MDKFDNLVGLYKKGGFDKVAWCDGRSYTGPLKYIPQTTASETRIAFGVLNKPTAVPESEWSGINPNIALKISLPDWEIKGLAEEAEIYQQTSKFLLANFYTPNLVLCLTVQDCNHEFINSWEPPKGYLSSLFGSKTPEKTPLTDMIQALKTTKPPRWWFIANRDYGYLEKRAKFNAKAKEELDATTPNYLKLKEKYEKLKVTDEKNLKLRLLITEKINGASLGEYFQKDQISDEELIKVVYQILFTLAIFNRYGIRHGDMHPGNVLLEPLPQPTKLAYVLDPAGTQYTLFETKWLVKIFDWDYGGIYETVSPFSNVINQQAILEDLCNQQASCGRFDKADMTRLLIPLYRGIGPGEKQDEKGDYVKYPGRTEAYPKFSALIQSIFEKRLLWDFGPDNWTGLRQPKQIKNEECPELVPDEYLYPNDQPWHAPDCWIKPIHEILNFPIFDAYKRRFNPKQINLGTPHVYGPWPDQETRAKWVGNLNLPLVEDAAVPVEEPKPLLLTAAANLIKSPQTSLLDLNSILFTLLYTLTGLDQNKWEAELKGNFLPSIKDKSLNLALQAALGYGRAQLRLRDPALFLWLMFIASQSQFTTDAPGLLYLRTTGLAIYSGKPALQNSTLIASLNISTLKKISDDTGDVPLFSTPFTNLGLILAQVITILFTNYNVPSDEISALIKILKNLPSSTWQAQPILSDLLIKSDKTQLDRSASDGTIKDAYLLWLYFKFAEIIDLTMKN